MSLSLPFLRAIIPRPSLFRRYQSTSSPPATSSKDPSHPYLHYHTLPDARLALSFLPTQPLESSRTILGFLPNKGHGVGLHDLVEQKGFLAIVHAAVKSGLEAGVAETIEYEAATRPVDGYITITDERAVPPAGRIGETEDLIGSVFVEAGKIVASTYSPLPTYRPVTAQGVLLLPRGLDKHLVEMLSRIDSEERSTSKV
ncbi:hypothetical protein P7C73_g2327, partial [Tremellales sp. Uapishka_1]